MFLRDWHPDWLSNIKWSFLETYMQTTLQELSMLYINVLLFIYAHNINGKKREDHEFMRNREDMRAKREE